MLTNDVSVTALRAIAWARARIGSTAYATRCLAFVEDAVERANDLEVFGGDTAAESGALYGAGDRRDRPAAGAFVFYRAAGPIRGRHEEWGHVGLSLGDGAVIHAWDSVRIDDYLSIGSLSPAPGWTAPQWWGWVPLEEMLRTARPHVWPLDETAEVAAERQQRASLPDA